jgi:hypothetical protein
MEKMESTPERIEKLEQRVAHLEAIVEGRSTSSVPYIPYGQKNVLREVIVDLFGALCHIVPEGTHIKGIGREHMSRNICYMDLANGRIGFNTEKEWREECHQQLKHLRQHFLTYLGEHTDIKQPLKLDIDIQVEGTMTICMFKVGLSFH